MKGSTILVDEKVAEVERKYIGSLQDVVEEVVISRFPNTPAILVRNIRTVTDMSQLSTLHRALLQAPDQAAAEALLVALSTAG